MRDNLYLKVVVVFLNHFFPLLNTREIYVPKNNLLYIIFVLSKYCIRVIHPFAVKNALRIENAYDLLINCLTYLQILISYIVITYSLCVTYKLWHN